MRHLPIVLLLAVLTTASLSGQENRRPRPRRGYPPELAGASVEVYKTVGDVKLNMYIFTPEGHKATDRRAAIVFFFGGGWQGGSPKQFHEHSKYLASRGMVAMAADYRVGSRHGVKAVQCVADAKSAVRWIRTNAERLGVDPSRIAAGGGSAGGHLAAATGTVPGLDEPGEDASVSSVPNAMVLFNPVYDNSTNGYGNSRVKDYWTEFSPLHNIDKDTPPAIVFFGSKEKLVKI
ncbi:MAG: alpha/beta hydrolase fold domain-containing protein, partial [Planctomycetes bacterium]|nr:alpha/beta hydrolase fold domain-containing protein [Planctomycetota bacterium]